MADKCIGKLYLDISQVKNDINEVNDWLKKIGANVNLEDKLSAGINKALHNLVNEAKRAGEEAQKAIQNATKADASGGLESTMAKVSKTVKTFVNSVDEAGNSTARLVGTVQTGFNAAGDKVKEFADATGQITRRTEEATNSIDKEIAAAYRLRDAELKADQARQEAAVRLAQKREEMAQQASRTEERERERALREASKMEAELAKAAANRAKEESSAHREIAKMINDANAARQKSIEEANKFGEKQNIDAHKQAVADLVKMYVNMYAEIERASKASADGDAKQAQEHLASAQAMKEEIDAIAQKHKALDDEARATERVIEARRRSQEITNRQDSKIDKQRIDEIERATQAYIKLMEAQAKLEQSSVTKGKDSREYAEASYAVDRAREAFEKYSDGARNAAMASDEARQAQAGLNNVMAQTSAQQTQKNILDRATDAYKALTTAVDMYNKAKRAKNADDMSHWSEQVNAQMGVLNGILQEVDALHLDESVRKRILGLIDQAKTQQGALGAQTKSTTTQTTDLQSAVNGLVTRYLSLLAVIRMIKNVLGEMVEYVTAYSDKMNEIRIITNATEAEAQNLGETYRALAENMSVSSLDMADAAIYFTRQGLGAADIEQRLKSTTMYAKTANIEFERAAELITAVVNSMGLVEEEAEDGRKAAQRVADVFLKVGDNAATSGEEIGEAMQKAAASAGTFGVQFEWLAAYIATVSETTRQEARTIGTAFNTIIARLHQIKQTGYNSDDETRINDIAKALANVDIALMDQTGEWRDMTDILEDVASKWGDMDDKTRSYVATTMAGVKQQNVFLALMNDMSKGIKGGSRAFKLYELAVDSAGTAEEKYGVYTESVTAAQERLNVASEKFYALLQSETLKGFYGFLTNIVHGITNATKAMNGWNIWISLITGAAVTALRLLMNHLQRVRAEAVATGAAAGNMSKAFAASHPVMLGITAMIGMFTALSAAASNAEDHAEEMSKKYTAASERLDSSLTKLNNALSLNEKFSEFMDELNSSGHLTNDELDKYNGLLDDMSKLSPGAADAVQRLRDGMGSQLDVAKELNKELGHTIDIERKISFNSLIEKYGNVNFGSKRDFSIMNYDSDITGWDDSWYDRYYFGDTESDRQISAFVTALEEAQRAAENNASDWDQILYGAKQWINVPRFVGNLFGGDYDYYDEKPTGSQNIVPQDVLDLYHNDELRTQLGISNMEDWARYIYNQKYGTKETRDALIQEITAEMNGIVDEVASAMGQELDPVELAAFKDYLVYQLTGGDMNLSPDDYKQMGVHLSNILTELMNNGFDYVTFSPGYTLSYIGRNLFGDLFDMIFDQNDINAVASDPDLVSRISEAYTQLLNAGFSNADIAFLFQDMDISQWDTGVEAMRQKLIERLRNVYSSGFGLWEEIDVDNGNNIQIDWLDGLSLEAVSLIDRLHELGVSEREINDLWIQSGYDIETFTQLLYGYEQELNKTARSISEIVDEIKSMQKEFASIDSILENIKKGESVKIADLLGLAEANPEILAMIHNLPELEKALEDMKRAKGDAIIGDIREFMLTDETVMANSPFAGYRDAAIKKLGDISDMPEVEQYIDQTVAMFLAASGELDIAGDAWLKSFMTGMFSDSNVDLLNRKVIDAAELVKAGWEKANEDDIATLFPTSYTAGDRSRGAGLAWNENVIISMTPILPDGTPLSPEAADAYIEELLNNNANIESVWNADKAENGGKGLLIDITAVADDESFDDAEARVGSLMELLHKIHEYLYDAPDDEESWLEKQVKAANEAANAEWAKSNNYVEQIGGLSRALESGGIEEAYAKWITFDDAMKKSVSDTYPELARAMLEVERAINDNEDGARDLDKAYNHLESTLRKSMRLATAKNFTNTYQAIQKLEKGTISAADAYDTFNKELDSVVKAGEDITDVESKMAKQTEVTASDVSNLSKVLGISAEEILQDWPSAVAAFDEMTGAAGELKDVFDMLNQAAFIRITGVSEADFSNIEDGLFAVRSDAEEVIKMLEATGQWEVVPIDLPQDANVWDPFRKTWISASASGHATVLRATGKNPYAGRGTGINQNAKSDKRGGGGGGGDKNSKNSGMTEVERMLDRMSQANAIQEYQQSYYQAQKNYYDQTGRLQGVIGYSQREIDLLKEQSNVLENNISAINQYIEKKKDELAALSNTDESYEEVADDLDKLQKAHQEYTNQLIENKTSIEELMKAIDDQNKKIREMEINLRQTILKAIEDREKRTEDMLNAEIEMENTILDLITKRYEKERDQIIETTNMKISALQQERDLLDEQLQIRKEQQEAEDKQLKLRELEAKYQRILADPTRMKEAKSIKSEIDDLRKEMAWDLAENEVKAQQDSIDQQIESLEDYVEYVQNYYEDLFEHPQKLIAEMKDIMTMTDAEIIDWLKTNNEEYTKSTENTQATMVTSWQKTLDTMHDVIKTYLDEVEFIISQGEDYIINFLMENSDDYRNAGKLQAEAYVDQWKEQLEDLRKAHEAVALQIAGSYSVIEKPDSSGSSKSGGGGGGSGGKGNGDNNNGKVGPGLISSAVNTGLAMSAFKSVGNFLNGTSNNRNTSRGLLTRYASGGVANSTGLAWLDGSASDPERVLSPYQTKLFEVMVNALENINRLSIPTMSNMNGVQTTGGGSVSVGDIIVNVDNLDTDDDYEDLADKVSTVIMERLGRTAAIGGLRIRSV